MLCDTALQTVSDLWEVGHPAKTSNNHYYNDTHRNTWRVPKIGDSCQALSSHNLNIFRGILWVWLLSSSWLAYRSLLLSTRGEVDTNYELQVSPQKLFICSPPPQLSHFHHRATQLLLGTFTQLGLNLGFWSHKSMHYQLSYSSSGYITYTFTCKNIIIIARVKFAPFCY